MNNVQWNLNQNTQLFIQQTVFEMFTSQCVKRQYNHVTPSTVTCLQSHCWEIFIKSIFNQNIKAQYQRRQCSIKLRKDTCPEPTRIFILDFLWANSATYWSFCHEVDEVTYLSMPINCVLVACLCFILAVCMLADDKFINSLISVSLVLGDSFCINS